MDVSYGYPNARIRAMKSLLLEKPFFERLIEMKEVDEIANALDGTPYRPDINEAILRKPGVPGIEEGLKRNAVKSFQKVLRMTEGHTGEMVKILLERWDVHNIRTIIRAKHIGAPLEDILDSLVPAGELTEPLLNQISHQLGVKEVIDLLATWRMPYAKPLTSGFQEYTKNKNIADLELALDRYYYESALGKLTKQNLDTQLLKEIVMRELDVTNIMTVIRLIREKVEKADIERFFIAGGKLITPDLFAELCSFRAPEDIVKELQNTPYAEPLNKGIEEYFKTGFVSPLERRLEEMIVTKSVALFKADPLSIAIIIAYVQAKMNEVVNLRIIVRGKQVRMPEQKIREALVIV